MILITMKDSQLNWLFIYYFFLYSLIFPPDPVKILALNLDTSSELKQNVPELLHIAMLL
tara:strand:+ start:207 stop:383 length:177 start_codon:yes stop_codon:yes gene_type:complete